MKTYWYLSINSDQYGEEVYIGIDGDDGYYAPAVARGAKHAEKYSSKHIAKCERRRLARKYNRDIMNWRIAEYKAYDDERVCVNEFAKPKIEILIETLFSDPKEFIEITLPAYINIKKIAFNWAIADLKERIKK